LLRLRDSGADIGAEAALAGLNRGEADPVDANAGASLASASTVRQRTRKPALVKGFYRAQFFDDAVNIA